MNTGNNKWGIIYHPRAGTRKARKRWTAIRAYIDSKQINYDYVQSLGYGSVQRLAHDYAEQGYRTIVIVGGDGALNDAINGIMTAKTSFPKDEIAIGIIPNGVVNDFSRYWGIDMDYNAAVDWIVNYRLKKIDVGQCTYYNGTIHESKYFVNAINIGLGARIVRITDQTKRFWGITLISSVAALFKIFFERKLYRMHLRINEDHIRGRIMNVCVGSARGYGMTPSAVPYNGWLDVSVIYYPKIWQLLKGLWMLINGRLLNHKDVKSYRTKRVRVLRAQNAAVGIDGRILQEKHLPLDITIMPETLTLIIPN